MRIEGGRVDYDVVVVVVLVRGLSVLRDSEIMPFIAHVDSTVQQMCGVLLLCI